MAATSLLLLLSALAAEPNYVYERAGNEADIVTAVKRGVVLLEPNGQSRVVGKNSAHFYSPSTEEAICVAGQPLQVTGIRVLRVEAGHPFDFATWTGTGDSTTVGAKAGATIGGGSL